MKIDDTAAAQFPLINAAWRFIRPFYGRGDLLAAWKYVHPTLRLCWAQWWLTANSGPLEQDGFDLQEVAQALTEPEPDHPLWANFQRVLARDLTTSFPININTAGIGTGARPLGVELEALYVHSAVPADGIWEDGAEAYVLPLVMRLEGNEWQLLNLGYEAVPSPGWPPQLWETP